MRLAPILLALATVGVQDRPPGARTVRAEVADVVRTADVNVRGLTSADFPRVRPLATNVYTFEQIDPTKRTVTVNNLIVVTDAGVLVAEGQGTADNVNKLTAAVRKLTPQPIKYVVVGSEHGDHTGGNSAFPQDVTFIATPKSKAALETQAKAP